MDFTEALFSGIFQVSSFFGIAPYKRHGNTVQVSSKLILYSKVTLFLWTLTFLSEMYDAFQTICMFPDEVTKIMGPTERILFYGHTLITCLSIIVYSNQFCHGINQINNVHSVISTFQEINWKSINNAHRYLDWISVMYVVIGSCATIAEHIITFDSPIYLLYSLLVPHMCLKVLISNQFLVFANIMRTFYAVINRILKIEITSPHQPNKTRKMIRHFKNCDIFLKDFMDSLNMIFMSGMFAHIFHTFVCVTYGVVMAVVDLHGKIKTSLWYWLSIEAIYSCAVLGMCSFTRQEVSLQSRCRDHRFPSGAFQY